MGSQNQNKEPAFRSSSINPISTNPNSTNFYLISNTLKPKPDKHFSDKLDFYFACKGFYEQFHNWNKETQSSMANIIYKNYLIFNPINEISVKMNFLIKKSKNYSHDLFFELESEVLGRFLGSWVFENYVAEVERLKSK